MSDVLPLSGSLALSIIDTLSGKSSVIQLSAIASTGQGVSGLPDPNYSLIKSPSRLLTTAYIVSGSIGGWAKVGGWISPYSNIRNAPKGTYFYQTTAYLFTKNNLNLDTTLIELSGQWSACDTVSLDINGVSTGLSKSHDHTRLTTFDTGTKDTIFSFKSGANVLTFKVYNDGEGSGLVVKNLAFYSKVPQYSVTTLPKTNLRFSRYYNQDYNIPVSGSPLKFSNFKGAINYRPNVLISFYNLKPSSDKVVYKDNKGRETITKVNTISLADINANSILRTKYSTDEMGSVSGNQISTTYVMLSSILESYITYSRGQNSQDDIFYLLLQKNNELSNAIFRTTSTTETTLTTPTIRDFLGFLNLDAAAPQVLSTIKDKPLDTFIFNATPGGNTSGQSNWVFKNNTMSILNRLKSISEQTNPLIKYTIQYIKANNNEDRLFIKTVQYIDKQIPLCYSIPIKGKWRTIYTSLNEYLSYGDVYKIFIGTTRETNAQFNIRNNLLLNFSNI